MIWILNNQRGINMKPTKEQSDIINKACDMETKILSINAGSGCGKTSSLKMVSDSLKKPSLYLAFNKSMADEASKKFGDHVDCMTTHSLAYRKVGRMYQHKLKRPTGRYMNVAVTGSEIARYFKLPDFIIDMDNLDDYLNKNFVGQLIKETVARFEQSDSELISAKMIPSYRINKLEKEHNDFPTKRFSKMIVRYANELWEERIDNTSPVLITHDTYLKLYQLKGYKLDHYEVIYLDEAQDTSTCVLSIFNNQTHALKILVGDKFQNIYAWRGSVNAMNSVEGVQGVLTKSFRFGQPLADIANKILLNQFTLTGNEDKETKVGMNTDNVIDYDKPYTILYRTNMELILQALPMLEKGESVDVNLDTYDFVQKLKSLQELKNDNLKGVKHEEILPFINWWSVIQEAKTDPELSRLTKIVEQGDTERVIQCLHNYKVTGKEKVSMITAHRSKGLEFDQVVLAEDFPSNYDSKGKFIGLNEQETNLLYVAATRAKNALQYNSTVKELLDYTGTLKPNRK